MARKEIRREVCIWVENSDTSAGARNGRFGAHLRTGRNWIGQSVDESSGNFGPRFGNLRGASVKHMYQSAVTAVSDTTITARVKSNLLHNKVANAGDIHVETVAGIVTLTGTVLSSDASMAAERVTGQTDGVKGVKNELILSPA